MIAAAGCAGSGLSVSPEAFRSNQLYIRNQVLPTGWQLNAVLKWDAYGHNISQLAGTSMLLGLPVSVLTNREAQDVSAAAWKVGVHQPGILRIVPADGPADFTTVLEAPSQAWGFR